MCVVRLITEDRTLFAPAPDVISQYEELFRRDQQRLADWPPRFKGEGPFLPTRKRRPVRLLLPAIGVLLMLLAAGLHYASRMA